MNQQTVVAARIPRGKVMGIAVEEMSASSHPTKHRRPTAGDCLAGFAQPVSR